MLTKEVANQMVEQTMIRLSRNINVMDPTGLIVASGEPIRLQQLHEGAAYVGRTGKTLVISEEVAGDWPGSKAGINLPLFYKEKLVAVIGITGNPGDLESVAPLVQLTCELMLHQSIVTAESEWNRKWKDDAITELWITGELSHATRERIALSHISVAGPLCCSLFRDTSGNTNTLRRKLEDFFDWPDKVIGVGVNGEVVVLTSGLSEERLKEKFKRLLGLLPTLQISVGKCVDTVEALGESLHASQVTQANQSAPLASFSEFELTYLLHQVPELGRSQYSRTLLASLDAKALETLEALFASNLSIRGAAESLGVHRHTLSYRIQQIEELTSLRPLRFEDAASLWLALKWREV